MDKSHGGIVVNKEKLAALTSWGRFLYIEIFIVLATLTNVIRFREMTDGGINWLYNFLAVAGAVLIVADLVTKRYMFKSKNAWILVAFCVAYVASMAANLKYGFGSNVKTLIWMGIEMFLLGAINTDCLSKTHEKHLRIITESLNGVLLAGVLVSLYQYLIQYYRPYVLEDVIKAMHEGFEGGRLYGVFVDPNYASLIALVAIIFTVMNFLKAHKNVVLRIYYIVSIVCMFMYIVLSGSRTTKLASVLVALLIAGFVMYVKLETGKKNIIISVCGGVVAGVLAAVVLLASYSLVAKGLSYVPGMFPQLRYEMPVVEFVDNLGVTEPETQVQENVEVTEPETQESKIEKVDFTRPDLENNDDISNQRFSIWRDYFMVFLDTPVFGTSARNIDAYVNEHFEGLFIQEKQYGVHNGYLSILVYTGLLGGTTMFAWMIMAVIYVLSYLIKRRNSKDIYYNTVLLMTMVLLVEAVGAFFMVNIFFLKAVNDLVFWMTIGYTFGYIEMSNKEVNLENK